MWKLPPNGPWPPGSSLFVYCFDASCHWLSAGPKECRRTREDQNLMGIAVWGIIDKCSRVELGLWAMPDTRVPEMPPAQLLHYIYVWWKREKVSGFAYYFITQFKSKLFRNVLVHNEWQRRWTVNLDFSESLLRVSLLLQGNCDLVYWWSSVCLSFMIMLGIKCSHFSQKIGCLPSRWWRVFIISLATRERGQWRPIWEKELGNVAHAYKLRMVDAGFITNDPVHS